MTLLIISFTRVRCASSPRARRGGQNGGNRERHNRLRAFVLYVFVIKVVGRRGRAWVRDRGCTRTWVYYIFTSLPHFLTIFFLHFHSSCYNIPPPPSLSLSLSLLLSNRSIKRKYDPFFILFGLVSARMHIDSLAALKPFRELRAGIESIQKQWVVKLFVFKWA